MRRQARPTKARRKADAIISTDRPRAIRSVAAQAPRPKDADRLCAQLLSDLRDACRSRGIPLTPQRRVVLETLAERSDHPTPEAVFEEARERLPGISRGTVYRVLEALREMGLAVRVAHSGSAVRFEARRERHHHVHCMDCGRVEDVAAPSLDRIAAPRTSGFEIHDHAVHFTGRCPQCRKAKA